MPTLETGVSQDLAKWRSANYSDIRYKLDITLEKGAPLMKGTIEIGVKLTGEAAKNDLILDWRTTQFQNDKDKPFAAVIQVNDRMMEKLPNNNGNDINYYWIEKEHLIVEKKYLKTGENKILVQFASPIKTSGAGVTRYIDKEDGAEYIYSLFVPSDASTAIPIFDQPDLKAKFQLNVTAPQGWKVVSNTLAKITQNLPVSHSEDAKKGLSETSFEETQPISTYVFAFAAGDFVEFKSCDYPISAAPNLKNFQPKLEPKPYLTKGKKLDVTECAKAEVLKVLNNDVTLTSTLYVRRSQAEKIKPHAAEVFRLNREGVKFLENYFDYKFPFPKYDLVLIPEFPFNGMEHAGATFLRETSVIFPTEPTKNDYVSRANVIFHEAAHQWFGDTVTMKWFDDLWLKEGFAEFMAYKTLEKVMPEYNAWKIFYERNKQAAYLTDSTQGTTPIYQEIKNLSAAKSAYGNIVYRKAPSFLKQSEFYLGEKEFQTAVRAFLKKHEFANAEWTDLVREFETAGKQSNKKDLQEWAEIWVKRRGVFKIVTSFTNSESIDSKGNSTKINYSIAPWYSSDFPESRDSIMHFDVLVIYDDETREKKPLELLPRKVSNLPSSFVEKKPVAIIPNYHDYGYGIFLLDEKSRDYVLKNIRNEKDDFLRAMMWGSLWDSVREAELSPKDYVELVIKNIDVESDESTIQTLLSRVSTAMNYYLNDAQRAELAPKIENLLIEKLQTAPSVGQKITYFRALQSIGSGEPAKRIFKQVLNDDKMDVSRTKGFAIKTKDKFDLVTRLLILDDKDAPAMLAELEKSEKSDEAKRYAYAAKTAIKTAENKGKFFEDFINNKEISESWIEAAFVPFNSIRHSELTLPFLDKALAELPNLKKNRKIFFVNGWLNAFISGQKSEEALRIINNFLTTSPNLDRDLRLKILENADNLERAVKIRAKYGK